MPSPPLTKEKTPLINPSAPYLLTEDGSDLLTTNAPSPLARNKAPLIVR